MTTTQIGFGGHRSILQFIRYGIIGVTSNAISYSIFLLFTYMGFEPKKIMTLLYLLGTIMSYVGNWRWTFGGNGSFFGTSSRFLLAYLMGYVINFLLLLFLVDHVGYPYQLIQGLAIILIACFLFVMSKYFVFRAHTKQFS